MNEFAQRTCAQGCPFASSSRPLERRLEADLLGRKRLSWLLPQRGSMASSGRMLVDGLNDDATYCALEFKPPNSSKSECIRGLGQTISYLAEYDTAALILPDRADDGYRIAEHIADLLSRPTAIQTRVSVYAYPVAAASPFGRFGVTRVCRRHIVCVLSCAAVL